MATSGQIQAALSKDLYIRLAWTQTSQDTSNNTSTVSVTLSVGASYRVSASATKSASITVNGSATTHSFVIGTHSGAWNKVIATRSVVIPHNSDGSKTFALSAWADVQITYSEKYVGRGSVSGSGTLNSIPRASSFSSAPNSTAMGSTWSATIAMASPSFSHAVDLIFGGVTHNIYNLLTSSVSYSIPLSWAARIPKATSGTMTVVLKTYSGTTLVGTKSYTSTLTVPSSVVPSFSSLAITRVDGPVPSAWNVYVQGKSKVTASIQSPKGSQGSTITGYSIKLDSSTATSQSKTFDLTTSGTKTITATIKDSRNRTATRTQTITVQPYSAPKLSNVEVERCLSNGTPDTDGTYLRAKVDYTLSSVAGKNTTATQTKITYRKKGTSTWTTGPTFSDNVYTSAFGGGLISTNDQYEVGIVVSDPISSSNYATTVGTALVTMDFRKGGRGVAFGMVASQDGVLESDFIGQFNNGFNTPRIPAGADLNTYTTPGQWHNHLNAEVAGFTNKPPSSMAGALVVLQAAGVIQYWHDYNTGVNGQIWRRRFYAGSWSDWQAIGGEVQPGQLTAWANRTGTLDNTTTTVKHYLGVYATLYNTRTYLVEARTPTWWLSDANGVMTMQLKHGNPGAKPSASSGVQVGRYNLTMAQTRYGAMSAGDLSAVIQVSNTGTYYFGLFFAPVDAGHTARLYDATMTITDYGDGQPAASYWAP